MENFLPKSAADERAPPTASLRWREDADEQSLMPESLRSLRKRPRGSSVADTASSATASATSVTSAAATTAVAASGASAVAVAVGVASSSAVRARPATASEGLGELAAVEAAELRRLAADSVAMRPSARIALPVFCVSGQTVRSTG